MSVEEEELEQLKKIYDELWIDARSMIKDMGWSINVYLVASIFIFCFGVATIFVAGAILSGPMPVTRMWLVPPVVILTTVSGGCEIAFSVILLYWYNRLKSRYKSLIQMEQTLGD